MDKKRYTVTENAGGRVNGKRVQAGDELRLTDAEAQYERDLGHIVPVPPEEPIEDEPATPPGTEA